MKSIFVSSTFRDFQQERDILRDRVLPRLNQEAKAYGESVSFCDLRWGIDTSYEDEEDSSKKILSVCLNEIDRSRPYMIVMLGQRYGYTPDESLIKREAERKKMDLKKYDISVTALEIEYGALQDAKALSHTLFYFREFENEADIPAIYKSENEECAMFNL